MENSMPYWRNFVLSDHSLTKSLKWRMLLVLPITNHQVRVDTLTFFSHSPFQIDRTFFFSPLWSAGPMDALKKAVSGNNDQNEHATKTTHSKSNFNGCQVVNNNNKMRLDLTPDAADSTNRTDSGIKIKSKVMSRVMYTKLSVVTNRNENRKSG